MTTDLERGLVALRTNLEQERGRVRRKGYHGPEADAFNRGTAAGLSYALDALAVLADTAGLTEPEAKKT